MNVKKLLAAVLCLAMALTLLPAVGVAAASTTPAPEGIVIFEEDDFANALNATNGYDSVAGQPKRVSVTTDETGNKFLEMASDSQTYVYLTLSNLNIASTGSTVICLEYRVSAPTVQYQMQIESQTTGVTITADANRSDATSNITFGIGNTDSTEFEVHRQYWTVSAGTLSSVRLRFGTRTGTGDPVIYDYAKLYVTSYSDADLKAELESEDGCAKLSADANIGSSLTLGENAVLDLNGHSLTATIVSPGTNATIIDSSANKTGKLIVPKDSLVLKSNNPQLPLWTGTGYIFTEPQLGSERAFLAASSADGFTMDFRPGFGTELRENVLSQGSTGVKMTADLSWTDIYGYTGSFEGGLNGTKIFNEMYKTATARGRLQITGAEKYRNISLTITLESCGVKTTFDPVVFNNTYVTTHFAANFDKETLGALDTNNNTYDVGILKSYNASTILQDGEGSDKALKATGTNMITFAQSVETGAGKTLVLDFDLKTDDGLDYFGFRLSNGGYVTVLGTGGVKDNNSTYNNLFANSSTSELYRISKAGEYVHIRMTINLETGAWEIYRGATRLQGAQHNNIAGLFNNAADMYLRIESGNHYIDNLLIYTVAN